MNTLSSLLKNLRNRTPVGTIQMYGGSSAPTNWLKCDGSAVSRETYASLFAVIGTTYGNGDGVTTFNLPNLTDRMPIGAGSTYALNASGGETTVKLSDAQMAHGHGFTQPKIPNHSHTCGNMSANSTHSHSGSFHAQSGSPNWSYVDGVSNQPLILSASVGSASTQHTHSITGGGGGACTGGAVSNLSGASSSRTAHNNMPPYRAVNFIIYAGV